MASKQAGEERVKKLVLAMEAEEEGEAWRGEMIEDIEDALRADRRPGGVGGWRAEAGPAHGAAGRGRAVSLLRPRV